jgi:hypothetical protein
MSVTEISRQLNPDQLAPKPKGNERQQQQNDGAEYILCGRTHDEANSRRIALCEATVCGYGCGQHQHGQQNQKNSV